MHERHILLIRHGETDANRDGIVQGHQPTPLNALGHRQALVLARRLQDYIPAIDTLVSSDLLRAVQTTRAIATAINRSPHFDPAWRERCYGVFEGKNRDERLKLREELAIGEGPPPGAQSTEDYQRSILAALHRLPHDFPDAQCIAVVTHAGAVRAVTMQLTADAAFGSEGSYHPCPNCSITQLNCSWRNRRFVFELQNIHDVEHLEPEAMTSRDSG